MTRLTGDDFMMVGLHKLAAERGDGLVPELLAGLAERRGRFDAEADIVHFRQAVAEMPTVAVNENKVIAFPARRRRNR